MEDLRISHIESVDSHTALSKDGSKKRDREKHAEPEEEPVDEVTLSSASEAEDPLPFISPFRRAKNRSDRSPAKWARWTRRLLPNLLVARR